MNNYSIKLNDIKEIDTQNMFDILKSFPKQVIEAIEIGKNTPSFENIGSNKLYILGMGGSAIGGDLISNLLNNTEGADNLFVCVNRNYTLPGSINENSNVIVSSYSGGTEETLSAFDFALSKTRNIICICSGGELYNKANANNIPTVLIPKGYQPRAALGYSFLPILYIILKSNLINQSAKNNILKQLEEISHLLEEKSILYSNITDKNNYALNISQKIYDTIPIIYSSSDRLSAVNFRWRCQIQENAKNMAFGNLLPEMNHNEINSWSYPHYLSQHFSMILLIDKDDHQRIKHRFNALKNILDDQFATIITVESEYHYFLHRIFDLIYLGDWISYYLAILNRVDPTPIPIISKLKNYLQSI